MPASTRELSHNDWKRFHRRNPQRRRPHTVHIAVESDHQYRVMLDVGAQVIELQNEEVAGIWLERFSPADIQAAIFFDHQNELCVLSRDG